MKKSFSLAIFTIAAAGAAAALGVHLARKNSDNKLVAKITDYINGITDAKDVAVDVPCKCDSTCESDTSCESDTPCECDTSCECDTPCECDDASAE